jgi:hypothetical protein
MDTRRSYYLSYRQDDFAELNAKTRQPNTTDIHYVIAANDNSLSKVGLYVRCWTLLRTLTAMHGAKAHEQRHSIPCRAAYRETLVKLLKGRVFAAGAAQ